MAKNKNAAREVAEEMEPDQIVKSEELSPSQKLELLKSELLSMQTEVTKHKPGSPEQVAIFDKIFAIGGKIRAEEAAVKKAEIEAKLSEERNARVQLALDLVNAVKRAVVSGNDSDYIEELEIVQNELLARYSKSSPAAKSSSSASTGTGAKRGSITSAIRELIVPMYANGVEGSEVRRAIIKDHGFNDGTANAAIRSYEIEIGLIQS